MEPEGTLPPYPESINPVLTLTRISSWYILILFSHLCKDLITGIFPSGFPTNIVYKFHISPFMLHDLSISSFIW